MGKGGVEKTAAAPEVPGRLRSVLGGAAGAKVWRGGSAWNWEGSKQF